MSEKRRRRKGAEDSEGSDLSETEPEKLNKSAGDHGDSEYESADEHIANSPKHKNTSPDAKTDKQEDTETEKQGDVTEKLDATEKKDDITDKPVDQKDIQEIKTDEPDVETDQQDAKKDDSDGKKDAQDSEAAKTAVSEEKFDDVKNAVVAEKNEDKSDDDDDVISVKDEDDNSDEDFIDDELDEDDDDLGMFYEHDDRLGTDEELEEEEETEEGKEKKKIWQADAAVKWGHDKFLELDQEPKSKDELVTSYGYDIRGEDNAPRARRRRRYGRGPNKYTRNWEDEDAYTKPGPKPRPPPNKVKDKAGNDVILEDFPALPSRENDDDDKPKAASPLMPESKPEMKREQRSNRSSADREVDYRRPDRRGRGRGDGEGRGDGGGRGDGERRGDGGNRSRGRGRGARGGGGFDQPRRGGGERGFGRGGYEDRRRFNERNERYDRRSNDDDRRPEDEQRSFRGRGGRGGQRHEQDQHDYRNQHDNRNQHDDRNQHDNRHQDLDEDLGKIDINRHREEPAPHPPRGGGKRYSYQRRGGGEPANNDQRHLQEMFEEGVNPALCSGPPRGRPFQAPMAHAPRLPHNARLPHNTMVSHSGMRPVPASFIQNPQMMNYNPQFGVPVTGGPPVSLPMGPQVVPLTAISALPRNLPAPLLAPGFHNGPPDPVLMANQPGPDGFAAVRGGVTYFNPTAQNILLPQRHHVNKRPKAAIPIVDPSIMESRDYMDDMNGHAELA